MHRTFRGVITRLLLCVALTVPGLAVITAAPAQATSCGTIYDWPETGHIQETNYPGTNRYYVTFQFTLTSNELCLLQSQDPYLAIKLEIHGFNLPANWSGYSITDSNLPGGIHAVDFMNAAVDAHPTITRIYTSQLQANTNYSMTMVWDAVPLAGQTPSIDFKWVPAHWAMWSDPDVPLKDRFIEPYSCTFGNNTMFPGSPINPNEAWCIFNDGPNTTLLFGPKAFDTGVPNGVMLLGGFRWLDWSPPQPVVLSSSTTAPSGVPANTNPTLYTADRTILHGPNGSLYVMAGGAKFYFGSMSEFTSLGYSTSGMVNIDQTTLNAIPTAPRNGTILRSGGGNIYVVAGGAKFVFGSWGEFTGQGYGSYINVPQAPLDQIGDAPGNKPANGTVLVAPNGSLSVVVGGVKFYFGSMTEYYNLGYTDSQMVRVSQGPHDAIPAASTATPPASGTILRSGGGQIYVVAGGAKFHFGTTDEYHNQGFSDSQEINVPQGALDAIGDAPGNMPRNGTAVLRPDGAVFVIGGGVRWYFGSMSEFLGDGYQGYVPVSQAAIDGIYDTSSSHLPTNGTLLQGSGADLWIMQSGQRYQFGSMTQFTSYGYSLSNVVRVSDGGLAGISSGGYLP